MKVIADVTARVGGALAGVLLGLVLAGALSQFLNLSCQLAPAVKSDHCGMLVWLVFAPLAACTGAFFGGMRGLSIESRLELDEWERAIGRVGLGLLCGVMIFLVLAVMSYEPAAETGRLVEARYLRSDLIVAAVNSIPALGTFVGAFFGWRSWRRRPGRTSSETSNAGSSEPPASSAPPSW